MGMSTAHQPARQLDVRPYGEGGQADSVGRLRPAPPEQHAAVRAVLGRQGRRVGRGRGGVELERAWWGVGSGKGLGQGLEAGVGP